MYPCLRVGGREKKRNEGQSGGKVDKKKHLPQGGQGTLRPLDKDTVSKEIVTEIYAQMQVLVQAGAQGGQVTRLNREQGGRVIRIAWIGQVYKHIPDPKSSYVCNWEEMSS